MTLKEAIEDSENLTDFIMDFDEEEEWVRLFVPDGFKAYHATSI